GQQGDLTVPADLQVPARHAGVRQPELGVLAAADHIGALTQLVRPAASVVELQCDGRCAAGRVVALAVAARVTGLLTRRLAVVVPAPGGFGVSGLAVVAARRGFPVAAVVGLCVALVLAPVCLSAVAALVRVAALVGIAALVGVATLIRIPRPLLAAAALAGLTAVVVVAGRRVVAGLSGLRRRVSALPV